MADDTDVDRQRLDALLGGPATAWLVDRAAQRLRRGRPLAGSVSLSEPTAEQRRAAEVLLGRPPGRGATLTVPLAAVDRVLRTSGACAGLPAAVTALRGPIVDQTAARGAQEQAWNDVHAWLADQVGDGRLRRWADAVVGEGLLRRLASGDSGHGRRLAERTLAVLDSLPAPGVALAQLAAATLGDSHGLDLGRPEATLTLRALICLVGDDALADGADAGTLVSRPAARRAESRRALWAAVGVLCDELSVSVVALDLPAAGDGLTDRVLRAHAAAGEPCRLTLGQLMRHPPALPHATTVFACENVAVVEAAARHLGPRSAPLVCVEGQPSTAVKVLLRQLVAGGGSVAYHGDFDWGGVRIGAAVLHLTTGRPWRFGVADYLSAPDGRPLRGTPTDAPWDPALVAAMRARGTAVEEETVLATLLDDLSA